MADNVVVHGASTTLTAVDDSGKALSEPVKSTNGALHVTNASYQEGQAAGHDFDRQAVADIGLPYLADADELVIDGPALVKGFICISGTNPKIALYNSADGSGTAIYPQAVTVHAIGEVVEFPSWILFDTAVYANVDGTSPVFQLIAVPVAP